MPPVTVVTLNRLNDRLAPTRWEARRSLIVAGLRALAPDLIGLQEVLDQPAPGDPMRDPSDHFGLAAWLTVP